MSAFTDAWYALLVEVDDAIVRGGWRIDEVGTEEVFDKHRRDIEHELGVGSFAPHPDAPHEFRTTCRLCGEYGWLSVSVLGEDGDR